MSAALSPAQMRRWRIAEARDARTRRILTRAAGLSPKQAAAILGSPLGAASKMPGRTFGLSPSACRVGSKLATIPGTPCFGCYAMRGHYAKGSVQRAHARRMACLQLALASPAAAEDWIAAAVRLIGGVREPYFRWHDSGDLQGVEHLAMIVAVARALPHVAFWVPTQERGTVAAYRAAGGRIPRNLRIRFSDGRIDQSHRRAPRGIGTSGVHTAQAPRGAFSCPARTQGNSCGACRACWSPAVPHVSYHVH